VHLRDQDPRAGGRREPAELAPGTYRNITGNSATALGFVAAAVKTGRPLFLGSYPITPASDVLHELAGYKSFPIYTFQAEDEIAVPVQTLLAFALDRQADYNSSLCRWVAAG